MSTSRWSSTASQRESEASLRCPFPSTDFVFRNATHFLVAIHTDRSSKAKRSLMPKESCRWPRSSFLLWEVCRWTSWRWQVDQRGYEEPKDSMCIADVVWSSGVRGSDSSPSKRDRKSTRLNSSHSQISYAVFCLK